MDNYLKVLIADDEEWLVKGMQKMIPWEVHGFTIVAVAYDGLSAVELAGKHKADIVFLDIRMPGLNGLEALKEIRSQNPNTVVTIISGYAEFAYAQKAVKNGASDYLLKPIDNIELLRCLSHMRTLCLQNLEQKQQEISSAEGSKLQELCALHGFTDESRKSVLHFRERLNLSTIPIGAIVLANQNDYQWLICASPLQEKELVLNLYDKCDAGISEGFYNLSSLTQARKQAAMAASTFWGSQNGIFRESSECDFEAVQTVNQLWKMYAQNNLEYFFPIFDKLEELFAQRKVGFQKSIALYNNLVTMQKGFAMSEDNNLKYLSEDDILKQTKADKSFLQLLPELRESLKLLFKTPSAKEMQVTDTMIAEILEYVDLHFCDSEISVEKLAANFFISSAYFGQIFKKSVGVSVMEYINKKRCDFAEHLMLNENLTVRDASMQVGIGDYFYFNKLYKKHKLTTPGKARREGGGHGDE